MHYANVLLRRANIARVFESEPRVTSFKEHGEHFAPQRLGRNSFMQRNFAISGLGLVGGISFLELFTAFVVEVGHLGWRKECPVALCPNPLHAAAGNPVGGTHVEGATALVSGALATR